MVGRGGDCYRAVAAGMRVAVYLPPLYFPSSQIILNFHSKSNLSELHYFSTIKLSQSLNHKIPTLPYYPTHHGKFMPGGATVLPAGK